MDMICFASTKSHLSASKNSRVVRDTNLVCSQKDYGNKHFANRIAINRPDAQIRIDR